MTTDDRPLRIARREQLAETVRTRDEARDGHQRTSVVLFPVYRDGNAERVGVIGKRFVHNGFFPGAVGIVVPELTASVGSVPPPAGSRLAGLCDGQRTVSQ
jgi:hypothetical protein